ncbi:MAG: hypothetical protein SH868_17870, partial [Bythopirellula sp.]|nr:hypothetical protein [Bythopirellula sp.]
CHTAAASDTLAWAWLVPPIKGKWFFPEGIFWAVEPAFQLTEGHSLIVCGKDVFTGLRLIETHNHSLVVPDGP